MQFASVALSRGNHECVLIRASFPPFVAGGQNLMREYKSRETERERVLKSARSRQAGGEEKREITDGRKEESEKDSLNCTRYVIVSCIFSGISRWSSTIDG